LGEGTEERSDGSGIDPSGVHPRGHVDRIESEQVAPFDVWDPSLVDEPANVALFHAEMLGECGDVDKAGKLRR
jgi:hypothetical protein